MPIPMEYHNRNTAANGALPSAYVPMPSLGRTNSEWVENMRCPTSPERESAVKDLRQHLRSGLGKAFTAESSVQEHDLDDFTHDAIVKILEALDSFRGESQFTTWAMAIAVRVAFTHLRRRRCADVSLEDIHREAAHTTPPSLNSYGPDRRVEHDELLAALRVAIADHLTERQRTVILSELQGVASNRVAVLLDTNRNAIYKVYHDARRKLQGALTEAGFTGDDVRCLLERCE